ncbi:MAG: glutamate decarboxylase [Bacillota bacterium]
MWTVVYIAPTKKEAEKIRLVLSGEGILVKLKAIGQPQQGINCSIEILVPEAEADEALEIINTL